MDLYLNQSPDATFQIGVDCPVAEIELKVLCGPLTCKQGPKWHTPRTAELSTHSASHSAMIGAYARESSFERVMLHDGSRGLGAGVPKLLKRAELNRNRPRLTAVAGVQ